ncbi:MAG: GAF domain-containing protein [Planctomycetes bacterium]|nr:GAF domain-containing protein [Planctomycetota bacterium]
MAPQRQLLIIHPETSSVDLAVFYETVQQADFSYSICHDPELVYNIIEEESFDAVILSLPLAENETKILICDLLELIDNRPLFLLTPQWEAAYEQEARSLGITAVLAQEDTTPAHLKHVFRLSKELQQMEASRSSSRVQLAKTYFQLEKREETLKAQQVTLMKMAKLGLDLDEPLDICLSRIAKVAMETLGTEYVSIWGGLLTASQFQLRFRFSSLGQEEIPQVSLGKDQSVLFIENVRENHTLAMRSIQDENESIQGFKDHYLKIHQIENMACGSLYKGGELNGILCFEGLNESRDWLVEELSFINSVADLITLTMEEWQHRNDERELRKREDAYRLKLEKSNSDLQDFAFIVSHDLQEPLYKVNAFGELLELRSKEALDEKSTYYVSKMREAAKRMSGLINDLLLYSRVTSKAMPFIKIDLNHVLEGVLSDLEYRIMTLKAKLEVEELITLEADESQMRQLFQNLISNSLKFHEKDKAPQISIGGEKSGANEYTITFKDEGIGFDEKDNQRIFGVFQRLHPADKYPGTGMGLAICEKIINRHEGSITAKSDPGEGTTFVIKIPLYH